MSEGKLAKIVPQRSGSGLSVIVTFPDSGVYELQFTATDYSRRLQVSRNTWIRVWDTRSPIIVKGKPDPLCACPGVTPPVVRSVSSDPGPFQHPRLLCSSADWPEIKGRIETGILASAAWKNLKNSLISGNGIDSPTSDFKELTAKLVEYADNRYQGDTPDLTCGIKPSIQDGKTDSTPLRQHLDEFEVHLRDACLVSWLNEDPSQNQGIVDENSSPADCRKLAKLVSAYCHLYLASNWDASTGKFSKDSPLFIPRLDSIGSSLQQFQNLALAYDFISPWMTDDEARETRNFLFAVSFGRATEARTFVPQVNGVWLNHGVERGTQQNGDFINIEELKIATALCIEGEESGIDPRVVKYFSAPAKPDDYLTSGKPCEYDWVKPVNFDSGRDNYPGSKPYPEGGTWPLARKVEVDNLQRVIWWNDDWYVSPWGFMINREAYYGYSAYGVWPAAYVYARHGAFNMYVASNFYQTALHHIYSDYPGETFQTSSHFKSNIYLYDHHDGGMDSRQIHALFLKYMYPDDPLVDYVYAPYAVAMEQRMSEPFWTCLFGLDPGTNGSRTELEDVGDQKALPLTKVDPQVGLVVARSGWKEDDAMLYFDNGWAYSGHLHAEKNSFAFFALGRPWAMSPGYHQKLNNFYSTIMIQDPKWANDPITQGYVGESESYEPEGSGLPPCHPTPATRLFQVHESPDHRYTVMAGDAKYAYDLCFAFKPTPDYPEIFQPFTRADLMYPGLINVLLKRLPDPMNAEFLTGHKSNVGWDEKIHTGYNSVQYAFRTIVFARGEHPYALIVDDFNKDNRPNNYRWMMNCCNCFGDPDGSLADEKGQAAHYSTIMEPDSTPIEATLLHLQDQSDKPGLPRLLVRDLSESENSSQPPMKMDTTVFTNFDNALTDRLLIERDHVVEPRFKVLLYPYRNGEPKPETTWSNDHSVLSIRTGDGHLDTYRFNIDPQDHRTRILVNNINF
jgi:hypothetical protein